MSHLLPGAAVALHARAGPVARQLEPVGRAAQLLRPVVEQLLDVVAVELAALPLGEVGVLDRQLRQLRLAAVRQRAVCLVDLREQQSGGEVVGAHVVKDDQQQILVVGEVHEGGAQQDIAGEGERPCRRVRRAARRRAPAPRCAGASAGRRRSDRTAGPRTSPGPGCRRRGRAGCGGSRAASTTSSNARRSFSSSSVARTRTSVGTLYAPSPGMIRSSRNRRSCGNESRRGASLSCRTIVCSSAFSNVDLPLVDPRSFP